LSSVNFTGKIYVGGLAGEADNGTINNCYSTGTVTGNSVGSTGGLIGASDSAISQCYSTVSVTSLQTAGGFIGILNTGGSISKCYSTGSVTGNNGSNIGGFIGYLSNGTIHLVTNRG
jgi:hypothetical protein